MNDENNAGTGIPVPDTVADAALQRFQVRTERLQRLIRSNAPSLVVANEVLLILDALWLLDPDAVSTAYATRTHDRLRRDAGFCAELGCGSRVAEGQPHGGLCVEHATAFEDEAEDDDLPEDDNVDNVGTDG